MVTIYFKKYKALIDNGEMTVDEAIEHAKENVPERWRDEVVEKLEELKN